MNMRFVWQTIAIAVLFSSVFSPCRALDEVTFKALLEKETIQMGEQIQYLVRVDFATTTMKPAVAPPSFSQFNVLNEYERIKEVGQGEDRHKVYRKIWLLQPNESGKLSIASAIVTYQDPTTNLLKNGKTDIVFLEVVPREKEKQTEDVKTDAESVTPTAKGMSKESIFLFGGVGLLVVGVIVVFLTSGSKDKGPKPEDIAEQMLQSAIGYAEQEDLDGYYKELSHALLDYIQNKFDIAAHVLPTDTVIEKLQPFKIETSLMGDVEAFFKIADQAKYGGSNLNEETMIKLHSTVEQFVEAGKKIKIKKKKIKPKKTEDDDL